MPVQLNTTKFCLNNPKESNSFTYTYLIKPGPKFEKYGSLGLLINLDFNPETNKKSIELAEQWTRKIIEFVKDKYYNPLKSPKEIDQEFENLLSELNSWIEREKVREDEFFEEEVENLNIQMFLIKDQDVHFAQIGEDEAYLIQDSQLERLSEPGSQTKFSNITSGSLNQGDILFFTSNNLFDYFSLDKISQIFQQKNIEQAIKEIQELLGDEKDKVSLYVLVVTGELKDTKTGLIETDVDNKQEIEEKIEEEIEEKIKENEEYKEGIEEEDIEKDIKEKEGQDQVDELDQKYGLEGSKKAKIEKADLDWMDQNDEEQKFSPIIKKPPLKYKNWLIKIISPLLFIFSWIYLKIKKKIGDKININLSQKILIVILLIIAVVFTQSIIILFRKEMKARQNRLLAEKVEEIKEKESALSIAKIYQKEEDIQKVLGEIRVLLKDFPQNNQEQTESFQFYQDKYLQELNESYHLFRIQNPKMLIDIASFDENAQITGITNLGDNFYVFDSNNNYIYYFDRQNPSVQLVNQSSVDVGHLKQLEPWDKDNLIGYDDNYSLVEFNTIDQKLSPLKLERDHEQTIINDLLIYGRRLYLLESSQSQIYKYTKTLDGFGKEEKWIQDSIDLSNGLSLTIDGNAYIYQNGKILKFYKGQQKEFELDQIQPELSHEQVKIFTDDDRSYLYLLDKPTKRLIIFSKKGKLIKQITSPLFDGIVGMVISRREDLAWILTNNKVFEIEL